MTKVTLAKKLKAEGGVNSEAMRNEERTENENYFFWQQQSVTREHEREEETINADPATLNHLLGKKIETRLLATQKRAHCCLTFVRVQNEDFLL